MIIQEEQWRKNLRNITPGKMASEFGKKGGSSKSPKKSLASKLRALRDKGMTDETSRKLYELMTDPTLFDLDILLFLHSIKKDAVDVSDKMSLAKLFMDFKKQRHGSKDSEKAEVNINVNDYKFVVEEPGKVIEAKTENEEKKQIEEEDDR